MKKYLVLPLLVFSASACSPDAVTPPASPASPSPAASSAPAAAASSGTLKYLGRIADRVSPAFTGGPDGQQDYVFSYSYDFGKEVTVQQLIISRIENGQPMGYAGWATSPGRYWLINVTANGRDLTGTSQKDTLGPVSGAVEFVMTGASNDPSLLNPGEVYELQLSYLDAGVAKVLTSRVTL